MSLNELNNQEVDYVKRATSIGIQINEMAFVLMLYRTRTDRQFYDNINHTPMQVQEEYTRIKIGINKVLANL